METSWFLQTSFLWSYLALLYVSQVSQDSPGFSADLRGACEYQGEEGVLSIVGLWCDMGSEAQSGLLALCLHHSTIHHICIFSLVAQLSDG